MSRMLTVPGGGARPFRLVAEEYNLNSEQVAYARSAGVRTEADLYSFLVAAPELGERGIFDTPDLTERLVHTESVATLVTSLDARRDSPQPVLGATAPPDSPFQTGYHAPDLTSNEMEFLSSFDSGPLTDEQPLMIQVCGNWPVRSQGQRGTCVSFATTAAYELYQCSSEDRWEDLSEQFLYWAIKHHALDGIPNQDGTWHKYAVQALKDHGISDEAACPYNPTPGTPVSHHPLPSGALTDAASRKTNTPVATSYSTTSGKAAILLNKLREHNGVAIALPVFDSPSGHTHNWITGVAQRFGEVQNPLPGWFVNGGHAVCCVGFVNDPDEPMGGYFVIRNSWGTDWGFSLPDQDYAGPEPGYGQVSASYVDRYLWEDCVF